MKLTPVFLIFILLAGCAVAQPVDTSSASDQTVESAAEAHEVTIFAMDTVMQLSAYGDHADTALSAAQEVISRVEKEVSVTDQDSEIYYLNTHQGTPYTVSEDTAKLIETSLLYGKQTNGALDISIYPIVKAWGFTTSEYQIPSDETIAGLLESVNYSAIEFDPATRTVCLPKGMEIDLGSIAKGYAGQLAVDAMRSAGVTSALISLGGNVQAIGSKPDGSAWRVAVEDPENTESYAGIVSIRDQAVITSGGYERYFVGDDGQTYCISWTLPQAGLPAAA